MGRLEMHRTILRSRKDQPLVQRVEDQTGCGEGSAAGVKKISCGQRSERITLAPIQVAFGDER